MTGRRDSGSTAATCLSDIVAHGGRLVTDCHAETVLVRDGAAYGVTARITDANDADHRITVRSLHVVVAAGAPSSSRRPRELRDRDRRRPCH
ncbi:GMC family oxidoreductase N-terminal domain-containing protein [Streptomyces sp. NPDC046237]|uniref:GMC family oxidoreductase N-terminal domain-containing protein n=1 Tax=Streptomyces sp. NPDC046237 TaxID=3154914 RepID=UPI0033DB4CCC